MSANGKPLAVLILCVGLGGITAGRIAQAQSAVTGLTLEVAPFTSENDVVVAHIDLTRLDTPQLVVSVQTLQGQLEGKSAHRPNSKQNDLVAKFDKLLRDVGCDHAFVIASWEEAAANRLNLIVHLREGSDVQHAALLLSTFFATGPASSKTPPGHSNRHGIEVVQAVGQVIFCGTRERYERRLADSSKVDLAILNRLLAEGNSSVIQLIVLPGHWQRVLKELNPPLPPQFGTTAGELANAIQHVRVDVTQQGDQCGVGYTVQATSEADAQRLAAAAETGREMILAGAGQANLGELLRQFSPRREGDRLSAAVPNLSVALNSVNLQELPPRKAANRAVSMNNMKQLALAMHNFHDAWGSFPPAASYDDQGKPLLSWRVYLLPFLAEEALYKQFHLDEPWDSPHNQSLIEKMPKTFLSRGLDDPRQGTTCYLVPVGPKTIFATAVGTPFQAITDGTSKTILIVEVTPEHAVTWTKPDDWPIKPDAVLDWLKRPNDEPFLVGRSDGSVQAFGQETSAEKVLNMSTMNGGEHVSQ